MKDIRKSFWILINSCFRNNLFSYRKHHPAEVEAQEQGSAAPLTSSLGGAEEPEVVDSERGDEEARERVLNGLGEANEETEEDDSLIIADEGEDEENEVRDGHCKAEKGERLEEEPNNHGGQDVEDDEEEEMERES